MNVMKRIAKPKVKKQPKNKSRIKRSEVILQPLDKRQPLQDLLNYDTFLWYDMLLDYIPDVANKNSQKMYNFLIYRMPLSSVIEFVSEYAEQGLEPFVFFERFIRRPEVVQKLYSMQKFLKSRSAEQTIGEIDDLQTELRTERNQVRNQDIRRTMVPLNYETKPKQPVRYESSFLSFCEREYQTAPWMEKYTGKKIKGLLIYTTKPTDFTAGYYSNGWYRVNKKWYKTACDKQPRNTPVAYLAVDGGIIYETSDMFKSSLESWVLDERVEDSNINVYSYSAAREMLKNSIIPKEDVDVVLSSLNTDIGPKTNRTMAKRLSWILVFLQKLITEKQVHHFRVKNRQYTPDLLVEMKEAFLLPEIYKNNVSTSVLDQLYENIQRRRGLIEQQFYERLRDPTKRRFTTPKPLGSLKLVESDAHSKCPPGVDDVVFYNHMNVLFCFARQNIINTITNPYTGQEWSNDFVYEMGNVRDPILPQNLNLQRPVDVVYDASNSRYSQAPGLLQKLKEEIELLQTFECSNCKEEILNPRYKSIQDGKRILFCSQMCFDDYDF